MTKIISVFKPLIAMLRLRYEHAKLDAGYRAMAADKEHEREALEWSEGLIGDIEWEDED